jgi:hypothetical protein
MTWWLRGVKARSTGWKPIMYRDCLVTSIGNKTRKNFELKINKLTPIKSVVILANGAYIHNVHSKHVSRLAEKTSCAVVSRELPEPTNIKMRHLSRNYYIRILKIITSAYIFFKLIWDINYHFTLLLRVLVLRGGWFKTSAVLHSLLMFSNNESASNNVFSLIYPQTHNGFPCLVILLTENLKQKCCPYFQFLNVCSKIYTKR